MSHQCFRINLTVKESLAYMNQYMQEEKLYEKAYDVPGGMTSATVVYEKYYMRNSSRAMLTVTINDFEGVTEVTSIAGGASQGMIFKFDWGASDEFAGSIKRLFEGYIL